MVYYYERKLLMLLLFDIYLIYTFSIVIISPNTNQVRLVYQSKQIFFIVNIINIIIILCSICELCMVYVF